MVFSGRRAALLTGALVLTVLAGATTALVTRDSDPTASLAPALDAPLATPSETPTPSPTPSATPEPTRSPAPSPTAARPTPSGEPRTASPTTAPAAGLVDYGPRSPGSVTVPYRAGQTAWDVTSNGYRILVTMTPAKAGSPMTWTIRATGPGKCCAISILFGDGFQKATDTSCGPAVDRASFSHTYNRGGRKEFLIQVRDAACRVERSGVVYGQFDVAPGPSSPQGPELPVVRFSNSAPVKGHDGDPHYVSLYGTAEDYDGHIVKFVVDFGDGSAKKTYQPESVDCQRSMDGWPTGTEAWMHRGDPPPYHYFAKPGTYTLTLTAYSASCDGAMVQTGSDSFEWTVPGPEPTDPA